MRSWMIVCVLALLSGCADEPKAPLPTTAYAGAPLVAITHHSRPDFAAITWSQTMMMNPDRAGLEGVKEGNDLVEDFQVADPAPAIASSLTVSLSQVFQTVPGQTIITDLFSFPPGGPGLLLEVTTESWGLTYIASDPAHYQVKYMGRARLMDNAHPRDLAVVPCRWASPEKDAPGYDELLGGNGALLKQMLASAVRDCAATYRSGILGTPALQQAEVN
jgi:hypothetical protein